MVIINLIKSAKRKKVSLDAFVPKTFLIRLNGKEF